LDQFIRSKGASCPSHQSKHVPLLSLQKSSWKAHISTFAEKKEKNIMKKKKTGLRCQMTVSLGVAYR